ncbi:MAG TPA: FtsX-like permease family protein [Paludibacter sp.]
MFKIHFLSAIRTLLKSRSIAFINVCGLTIGLTAFLLIVHYLFYEISFDSFFPESNSVYRVNIDIQNGSEKFYHGTMTSRGLYFACKKDVPGIEANGDANFESCLMRYKETQIAEQRVLWVDEGFEKVFLLQMIKGKADFTRPLTGIIARSKIHGLFGNEDPIGKIMKVNEGMPIEITGIYNDLPSNTHLTADYFISLKTWEQYGWISRNPDWNWNCVWNYIKLKPSVSPQRMEEMLTGIVNANTNKGNNTHKSKVFLQPLSDLHYFRGLEGEMGSQTNQRSLFILFVIALLTILIAGINYVNLSTAMSSKRANEIGMRKLIGATRFHIWLQAFFETIVLNIIAFSASYLLYHLSIHAFARYFEIPLSQAVFPEKYIIWSLLGILLIGIFLSSIYNTINLVGLNPFNGKTAKSGKQSFQRGMVIAQMTLSIIFISSTLMVYKQIVFMKNKDLGMNLQQVTTISAPASLNNSNPNKPIRFRAFREELLQYSEFKSITANSTTTGQESKYGKSLFERPDAGIHPNTMFLVNNGDEGLIETFGLKLLAGRNFSPIPSENNHWLILNERSIKEFGYKNPEEAIGGIIRYAGDTIQQEIIGVLADFHNEGLQKPIYPIIYNYQHPSEFGYYSVKLNTKDVTKTMDHLKSIWAKHYPSDPMNYVFADEFFFRQYQSEARFGKFYTLLTILSIAIACLGLYGLIMFYLSQKRKEIGIRKVNGAQVSEILIMLNKDFIKWVVLAFVIATPIAWYAMNKWFENFAYKTELSWWVFGLAGLLALGIALLTVTWQSLKAANRNPVEALKKE